MQAGGRQGFSVLRRRQRGRIRTRPVRWWLTEWRFRQVSRQVSRQVPRYVRTPHSSAELCTSVQRALRDIAVVELSVRWARAASAQDCSPLPITANLGPRNTRRPVTPSPFKMKTSESGASLLRSSFGRSRSSKSRLIDASSGNLLRGLVVPRPGPRASTKMPPFEDEWATTDREPRAMDP